MEKNLNNLNKMTYNGDVKVSVIDGKRVLYSSHNHNAGKRKLFEFLASCLIGNFSAASSSIPCRIACFDANNNKVSTYVYCDSSKYLINSANNGVEVTFRFRIPYTCLKGDSLIKCFALFPDVPTNIQDDRCAEYTLAGNGIKIPKAGGNFTIVIEWKMILKDVSTDADTSSDSTSNHIQVGDLRITRTNYNSLKLYLTDEDLQVLNLPEDTERELQWFGEGLNDYTYEGKNYTDPRTYIINTFKIIDEDSNYYTIDSNSLSYTYNSNTVKQFAIKKELFENVRFISQDELANLILM